MRGLHGSSRPFRRVAQAGAGVCSEAAGTGGWEVACVMCVTPAEIARPPTNAVASRSRLSLSVPSSHPHPHHHHLFP